MPSFSDSIFLFILALLLFGPKKLPKLARELGKWVGEFRRASNEFKMQMEEEMRVAEQADRQKEIAAMEAAAPVAPTMLAEPVATAEPADGAEPAEQQVLPHHSVQDQDDKPVVRESHGVSDSVTEPLPIAVSGDLKIMPPATGLPKPRAENGNALGGLLESLPMTEKTPEPAEESAHHGD
jgi:sec-independent protein translocase protein TatB